MKEQTRKRLRYLAFLAISILLAFGIGAIVLSVTGHDPLTAAGAQL